MTDNADSKNSPKKKAGAKHSFEKDLEALQSLIFGIPTEVLIDRVRRDVVAQTDIATTASFQEKFGVDESELPFETDKLLSGTTRRIAALIRLASIGDQRATLGLKELAESISRELTNMTFLTPEVREVIEYKEKVCIASKKKNRKQTQPRAVIEDLERHSIENLNEAINEIAKFGAPFLPISSEALFADETLSVRDWKITLQRNDGLPEEDPSRLSAKVTDDINSMLKTEDLIELIANVRFRYEATAAAREVAAQSFYWPLVIDAIEEARASRSESRAKAVGIGTSLHFRVFRKSNKGRGRDMKPRSGFRISVEIGSILNEHRAPLLKKSASVAAGGFKFPSKGPGSSSWLQMAAELPDLQSEEAASTWAKVSRELLIEISDGDLCVFQWPFAHKKGRIYDPGEKRWVTIFQKVGEVLTDGFISQIKPSSKKSPGNSPL